MNSPFDREQLPWKDAKLSREADNDLTKQWSVSYGIWDFDKNAFVRKRVIIKGATVEERLEMANEIIAELQALKEKAYLGKLPEQYKKPKTKPGSLEESSISPSLPIAQAVQIYLNVLAPNTFKSYRTAVLALQTYL